MIGSGFLLGWNVHTLSLSMGALASIALVLLAIFTFIAGATWMSRLVYQSDVRQRSFGFPNGTLFALLLIAGGSLMLCFNAGILPGMALWYIYVMPFLKTANRLMC